MTLGFLHVKINSRTWSLVECDTTGEVVVQPQVRHEENLEREAQRHEVRHHTVLDVSRDSEDRITESTNRPKTIVPLALRSRVTRYEKTKSERQCHGCTHG
jgi:hypothetical protein